MISRPLILLAAAAMAGCQTPAPAPGQPDAPAAPAASARSAPSPAAPGPAQPTRARQVRGDDASRYATAVERIMAEGLELYDRGEYAAAIRKFSAPELAGAWPELRLRSLKYLAFSYCVTQDLARCQQAFHHAMLVDPLFQLAPSEAGHPIWGPAFQKARAALPAPSPRPR